ncbi:hypothetical protein SCHPADRAFT_261610 [Schizopora paradoxa]|uniref:Uncharacterized protein n=1 Tax=Schizopora paradoxa TaxID=27342 RepID=A0A0H2SEI0_9AGAM|nr:hypothetical protein SCHPADRAFT_261610 [Schizopora paradoxa]
MVSKIWHSHQSIEAYCAEKTEALLKTLDELFCDIRDVVETIILPDESITHLPIDALRLSTGQSNLRTHIHRMQLEVLTRALQIGNDKI